MQYTVDWRAFGSLLTRCFTSPCKCFFWHPRHFLELTRVGQISSSLSLPCQYYWDHGLLFRQWQHFSVQDCLVVTWNSQKRREELPSRRESTVFSNWTYIIYQPPPITILLKKLPTEAGLFSNHRIESSPLKIAKHADYIIIVAEASLHYFFHAKVTKK